MLLCVSSLMEENVFSNKGMDFVTVRQVYFQKSEYFLIRG